MFSFGWTVTLIPHTSKQANKKFTCLTRYESKPSAHHVNSLMSAVPILHNTHTQRFVTVQLLLYTRHMSGTVNEYRLEDKRFGMCCD